MEEVGGMETAGYNQPMLHIQKEEDDFKDIFWTEISPFPVIILH